MNGRTPIETELAQVKAALAEVRSLLIINQSVTSAIEQSGRENTIDINSAHQKISAIETTQAVIINRLDRIDRDAEDAKEERQIQRQLTHSQTWMIWTALIGAAAAILAAIIPMTGQSHSHGSGAAGVSQSK